MTLAFNNRSDFNDDISGWDVSSVTDMSGMFLNVAFNQDISEWDVSLVSDLNQTFNNTVAFNKDISGGINLQHKCGRLLAERCLQQMSVVGMYSLLVWAVCLMKLLCRMQIKNCSDAFSSNATCLIQGWGGSSATIVQTDKSVVCNQAEANSTYSPAVGMCRSNRYEWCSRTTRFNKNIIGWMFPLLLR